MSSSQSTQAQLKTLLNYSKVWPYIYRINLERFLDRIIRHALLNLNIECNDRNIPLNKLERAIENTRPDSRNSELHIKILVECKKIIEVKDLISDRSHQSDDLVSRIQFHSEPHLREIEKFLNDILVPHLGGDEKVSTVISN